MIVSVRGCYISPRTRTLRATNDGETRAWRDNPLTGATAWCVYNVLSRRVVPQTAFRKRRRCRPSQSAVTVHASPSHARNSGVRFFSLPVSCRPFVRTPRNPAEAFVSVRTACPPSNAALRRHRSYARARESATSTARSDSRETRASSSCVKRDVRHAREPRTSGRR